MTGYPHRKQRAGGARGRAIGWRSGIWIAVALSAPKWPTPAQAQALTEVIVTAQRRDEDLQRVPLTIDVVGRQDLRTAGVASIAELPRAVPGLVITRTPGTPSLYIRGVGTTNGATGEEGSNAVYVDGVYLASLNATIFQFNDVERIEVLKGPQGTLFGRNATGGLLNVITRDPTSAPRLETRFTYGDYGAVSASAYGTSALADGLSANIATTHVSQRRGWGRNLLTGDEIYRGWSGGARAKLLWDATPKWRLLLSVDHARQKDSFSAPRTIVPGGVNSAGGGYLGAPYWVRNNVATPWSFLRSSGASLRVEHDLGWATLVSLTARRTSDALNVYDQDGSEIDLATIEYRQADRQASEEIHLKSPDDARVQWIAGLFFLDLEALQQPLAITGAASAAAGGKLSRYGDLRTRSRAAFAQLTAPIGPRTRATIGLRYTSDKRRLVGREVLAVGPDTNLVDRTETYDDPTYRLALDHRLSSGVTVYASYNTGLKSGAFNLSNLANPPVRPEKLAADEVGLRSEFLDRRLRLNLSAWRYRYKDIQLVQSVLGRSLLLNAAAARLHGLDADVELRISRDLSIRSDVSLIRGRYVDFPGAPATLRNPVDPTRLPPGYFCSPPFATTQGGNKACSLVNARGNGTIRTPDATVSTTIDYRRAVSFGAVGGRVSYYYNSGFFYEADNRLREPAYDLVSAEAYVALGQDRVKLGLWVTNLLDERHNINISSAVSDNFTPDRPRMIGIRAEMAF
ncbi:TonB-dependent receptor [Caulobacter sp. 602-1]|uniref:TonB-dependent receptor n=1 Tax=Caulobacter sp. 602-1 TaxID=2492472 RepID=UPI000F63EC5B|nr:TonB-dependent receptor [Caulobacter sp. 602-1]RRN63503.1 hypothetical protein EIK80_16970 [Caulobacter sp. 602-1]